jgi:integrase
MTNTTQAGLNSELRRCHANSPKSSRLLADGGTIDDITLVSNPTRKRLNDQQIIDYRHSRERFIKWLAHYGKDPDQAKGYAPTVVKRTAGDTDKFYRYTWDHSGGYTTEIDSGLADAYLRELTYEDASESHLSNVFKSLKRLFRWLNINWDPAVTYHGPTTVLKPREYLTREERRKIREAVFEWDAVPAYSWLSPKNRCAWKEYLANQLGKSADDITIDDFDRGVSYKYTSLVWTSLDAGLRPVEVRRMKPYWIDSDNSILRIPADESAKNHENWTIPIRDQTAEYLDRWLRERHLYDEYNESDAVWLTRHGNGYGSTALKYVLGKLCDIAEIDTQDRKLSWYSIRHSTGTAMSEAEGLKAAQMQLRHRSVRTTMKYDNVSTDRRRDALNRID